MEFENMEPAASSRTESAGVVVIRFEQGRPKLLLMRVFNYWDFPKGGIEPGENKLEAAIREVKEESGISDLAFHWGKSFYETEPYGKNNKVVYYFMAETKQRKIVMEENPISKKVEHEEYRWVSFGTAKRMTGERLNKVLEWAEERMSIYRKLGRRSR